MSSASLITPIPSPPSSNKALALPGSPGDSGYESSWPSLPEAAAWSNPGQKRRGGAKSVTSDGRQSPNLIHRHQVQYLNSSLEDAAFIVPAQYNTKGPQGQGHPGNAQTQKLRPGKGQRRKARALAYQAKRMAQHQTMTPLVDFGSPLMEDDDQFHGPATKRPIPLSVIPRGWLFEEAAAPSLADDVLIALPKREWVYDSKNPIAMDTKSFVVMSWNLLSPRLCHPLRLDVGCEPAFLEWKYRREAILHQIAFTDADIVCLQELELKDYEEYFNPCLTRLGFRSIHAYKMNVYEMRDGCAIFYRDSRFKLLNEHVLRFNQVELDDYNVKRPSLARDTAIRFNLFHNLAIVALFENRRTKRLVQVATTHLLADPAFPDAKMLQTAILTSKLEELKEEALNATAMTAIPTTPQQTPTQPQPQQKHIPTILAGDFNSLPDSSVAHFLKMGQIETSHFGDNDFGRFTRADSKFFYHHLKLTDSYRSSALPFTNSTRQFQGTIDYLLYDPSSLGLVGFLDHFEPEPSTTLPAHVNMSSSSSSSSDFDSGLDHDVSSYASSTSSSLSQSSRSSIRGKEDSGKKTTSLDFSKLFRTTSTTSTSTTASNTATTATTTTSSANQKTTAWDSQESRVVRASLPTALPNQYFPSDHIPLVAVFREREYIGDASTPIVSV
ncbi:Glucose-repressible alcohol dehydrogenase transcriptional effector [Mortierella polycephala]|uniref:Glucose-repressible alcohol dehydrogenase transcriptional effector n=1 Tax=Mortierella polycephala TaxID=41804 RepID=A0A9P6U734_9FUNG|nr:Glucose-repressible alcohol dehydrogenase transcriptional effector [Mortierella polycephala]